MEVPSQSFPKNQVPSMKQNETKVPKNKVFKPHVPNMFLTIYLKTMVFMVVIVYD
jgi:hypothetical protein